MQTTKMDGKTDYICDSIELENPWTTYRKLLVSFTEYLRVKEREKAFKLFCLHSIPTKNWDNDILVWLKKLEQSNSLSMNKLDIPCRFLEAYNNFPDDDSGKIWSDIRKFKYQLKLARMLSDDDWMYSRGYMKEVFEVSKDLGDLLNQWRQRITEAPLSWPMISKIYSQATQRIAKVSSESTHQQQDERSPSLEAMCIAKYLMDIKEITVWLTSNTSSEDDMERKIKKTCKLDVEDCDSIELEKPWTTYRKLLVSFTEYLRVKERETAFKLFCLHSIPTTNWDNDIREWLMKLEQSNSLSMIQLDILCRFLEAYNDNDSGKIWSEITKFKYQLKLARMLLGGTWSDDDWMYSRGHMKEVFEVSKDLGDLLNQWRQRITEAPHLSWPMISKIYSQATQRIAKASSESTQDKRSPCLEAMCIAKYLIDIKEITVWLTSNTSSEDDMERKIKKTCKLDVEDYVINSL